MINITTPSSPMNSKKKDERNGSQKFCISIPIRRSTCDGHSVFMDGFHIAEAARIGI